jgi:Protein of unknown function (DUF2690)
MSKTKTSLYSWLAVTTSLLGLLSSLLALVSPQVITGIKKLDFSKIATIQEPTVILSISILFLLVMIVFFFLFRETRSIVSRSSIFLVTLVLLVTTISGGVMFSSYLKTPGCSGHTCTELDPRDAGCIEDGKTVVSTTAESIEVNLRFSQQCKTVWVHAIAPQGSRLYVEFLDGKKFGSYVIPNDGIPSAHYSNMASLNESSKSIRACAYLPNQNTICTDSISIQ